MKTTKSFKSKGLVLGNIWGGGEGSYPAKELKADTKEEILKQANEGLDGSLDSGMGFDGLIGALLEITTTTTIIVEGKTFTNDEIDLQFIGKLTRKQEDFLLETQINM